MCRWSADGGRGKRTEQRGQSKEGRAQREEQRGKSKEQRGKSGEQRLASLNLFLLSKVSNVKKILFEKIEEVKGRYAAFSVEDRERYFDKRVICIKTYVIYLLLSSSTSFYLHVTKTNVIYLLLSFGISIRYRCYLNWITSWKALSCKEIKGIVHTWRHTKQSPGHNPDAGSIYFTASHLHTSTQHLHKGEHATNQQLTALVQMCRLS